MGFVNFYRQLWYRQSHLITPLAAITINKSKWIWEHDQQNAFVWISNTIANLLLNRFKLMKASPTIAYFVLLNYHPAGEIHFPCHTPEAIQPLPSIIPMSMMNHSWEINIAPEIVFINKIDFFVSISMNIQFSISEMLANQRINVCGSNNTSIEHISIPRI
jgi:hypothetical protein